MASPENRLSKMITCLREQRFRLTPQRMAIVKILASNEEHLSAEKIYARVKAESPFTSLATIYKTLTLLKSLGEVMELGFVDDSNRYDGARPYPHPHLICIKCRRILDPDLPALSDLRKELAKKTGYDILNHRLDFFGVCPQCQSDNKKSNRNR